jgi:hypothetical protein
MSPVLTRPRRRSGAALFPREVFVVALAGAIGIVALAGIHAALRGPEFVDRVTVVNETPYLIDLEITSGGGDGWLGLGPVSPDASHSFRSVVDQGDRWIFHVTAGPYEGGEFSLSKTELERGHWRVTIPVDVDRRLESSGAAPRSGR